MEDRSLIERVQKHCAAVNEPYVLTEGVQFSEFHPPPLTYSDGGWYVLHRYLFQCLEAPYWRKACVIDRLQQGWAGDRPTMTPPQT
jgi:hypothetical protein